jgi:hypothetical protein
MVGPARGVCEGVHIRTRFWRVPRGTNCFTARWPNLRLIDRKATGLPGIRSSWGGWLVSNDTGLLTTISGDAGTPMVKILIRGFNSFNRSPGSIF